MPEPIALEFCGPTVYLCDCCEMRRYFNSREECENHERESAGYYPHAREAAYYEPESYDY